MAPPSSWRSSACFEAGIGDWDWRSRARSLLRKARSHSNCRNRSCRRSCAHAQYAQQHSTRIDAVSKAHSGWQQIVGWGERSEPQHRIVRNAFMLGFMPHPNPRFRPRQNLRPPTRHVDATRLATATVAEVTASGLANYRAYDSAATIPGGPRPSAVPRTAHTKVRA